MNTLFPFGFSPATQLYLSLYVLTFAVHVVLMSYVLAGTGYVAISALFTRPARGDEPAESSPVAASALLIDWLPFALGVAITAGVAPLLFLQILYKESFYTANLLLFHRWMAIVPVLIVGFYLLYLRKSETARRWPRAARAAVSMVAFGCFGFTAWSWTGNHLLALDRAAWVSLYESGATPAPSAEMLTRLALWGAAAVPIMAAVLGWQLRSRGPRAGTERGDDAAVIAVARVALLGLAASVALAYLYVYLLSQQRASGQTSPFASAAARPYVWALVAGVAAQAAAWGRIRLGRHWSRGALVTIALGVATSVLAGSVVRESLRLSRVDVGALAALHQEAAGSAGMVGFLISAALVAGVAAWCLVATRRALRGRLSAQAPAQTAVGDDEGGPSAALGDRGGAE